ncbi:MAG TPA: hypothetical protein VF981_02995 [Gemmatimonadaceae bacterium]
MTGGQTGILHWRFVALPVLAFLTASGAPRTAVAQAPAEKCAGHAAFTRLDFWLGDWVVFVGAQQVGENRIQKVQDGCAITEQWRAAGGGTGQSLFYVHPADLKWRQVWVTAGALSPGGVKEKQEADLVGPGMRFQGTVSDTAGRQWLDRTTLTPNPDGSVRQHIEISSDRGATWRTTFDATYKRR